MNYSYEPKPWPEVLSAEEAERFIGGQTMMKVAQELGLEPITRNPKFTRYDIKDLRAFIDKIKVELVTCRRRGVRSQYSSLSAFR
jgi:hypothetical protein